jgi:hypothetical protein
MKYIVLTFFALALIVIAGCQGPYYESEQRGGIVTEPSGAERMTNAPIQTPARDINQRPYPGADPANDVEKRIDSRTGILNPDP